MVGVCLGKCQSKGQPVRLLLVCRTFGQSSFQLQRLPADHGNLL